jgi:hypothetical protein
MITEPSRDWNVFQQIFVEHWDGFKRVCPRYDRPYYDGLVDKMLGCGNPEKMGYIAYRCLHCGEGTHRVSMSCKSSLCLRCTKVYVDNWVSQVSRMLHEGVIYRPPYCPDRARDVTADVLSAVQSRVESVHALWGGVLG